MNIQCRNVSFLTVCQQLGGSGEKRKEGLYCVLLPLLFWVMLVIMCSGLRLLRASGVLLILIELLDRGDTSVLQTMQRARGAGNPCCRPCDSGAIVSLCLFERPASWFGLPGVGLRDKPARPHPADGRRCSTAETHTAYFERGNSHKPGTRASQNTFSDLYFLCWLVLVVHMCVCVWALGKEPVRDRLCSSFI